MAAAAEVNTPTAGREQSFGYSLHTVRRWGAALCAAAGVEAAPSVEEEVWLDFITGVQENVVISDQIVQDERAARIRERLKFDPMRPMEVRDGHVVTKDGRPVVELCWDGWEAAKKKAQLDPRMDSEVERSAYDIWVAQQVDKLKEGEVLAVPSMEPLEAMDRDGDVFWKEVSVIGYTRGLAVWQVYAKVRAGLVLAGAYSIRSSSKVAFQKQLAVHGVDVPVDTPANRWILHPVVKRMTAEEAVLFGPQLQQEYKGIIGRQVDEISVTKLIEENRPLVRAYFDVYMKALARAHHTGNNNYILQGLAAELRGKARIFSAGDREAIARVAGSPMFSEADALFMEKIIRYACAEELWQLLLHGNDAGPGVWAPAGASLLDYAAVLHVRAASRVQSGIVVGRSGGGCNALRFDRPDGAGDDDGPDDLGQQDVFGGNTVKDGEDSQPLACAYTHNQCYCSPYDDFGNPTGVKKRVVAYRDRKGVAKCLRDGCGAKIDAKSNVLSKGGIYTMAQKKQERVRLEAMARQVLRPRVVEGLPRTGPAPEVTAGTEHTVTRTKSSLTA